MASWFKDFADSVQAALPKLDVEGSSALLQSLTLTTPALTAERERIDAEEKEKERDRNMLAGLLPWETRDPERDILVEECHDAILLLSQTKATFFGPYAMPPTATIATMKPKLDEHETDVGRDQLSNVTKNTGNESTEPSEESQEKLAKLVPLPPLLQNFDLQVHVGLIERLLREDPKLVQMQSNLSGGGARERIFWKNYFFHCAYTRYEAGLSIDEIWSNLSEEERSTAPVPTETSISGTTTNVASAFGTQQVHLESTNAAAHLNRNNDNVDETITFESGDEQVVRPDVSSQLFRQEENASTDPGRTATSSALAQSESDYELVGDGVGSTSNTHGRIDGAEDDVSPLDDADYELDELEAEIARELED